MDPLEDLYQEIIFSHAKHPRHFKPMDAPSSFATGYNPLCGDRVEVFVKTEGETIREISFQGECCSICKASASLMCVKCTGQSRKEGRQFIETFLDKIVTNQPDDAFFKSHGELQSLQGVRKFPARIKCATLAWHSLKESLQDSSFPSNTATTTAESSS